MCAVSRRDVVRSRGLTLSASFSGSPSCPLLICFRCDVHVILSKCAVSRNLLTARLRRWCVSNFEILLKPNLVVVPSWWLREGGCWLRLLTPFTEAKSKICPQVESLKIAKSSPVMAQGAFRPKARRLKPSHRRPQCWTPPVLKLFPSALDSSPPLRGFLPSNSWTTFSFRA
jgi:hypothetical protein